MPANLTPAYKSAEAAYKRARDPKERLELLRDMLRLIPKHKGTDHLQADIKSKMKELTEALAGPKKGGARGGPPTSFRPEGAGQIVLIGPPNTGKSTLHVQLTGSHSETGPYPFTTQFPQPGMMPHLDIAFQLLDLPPISAQHPIPWIGNTLQAADGCLLVVDLGHPECIEETLAVHEILRARKVELTDRWPSDGGMIGDPDDPFTLFLPTILVATKSDRSGDPDADLDVFEELTGFRYPYLAVGAEEGRDLEALGSMLFERLEVVRVYSKAPGKPPDNDKPFTLRKRQTVDDLTELVHRDFASGLQYARVWGDGCFDGQHVGRDHQLVDGNIVELHM
ncbi:MAG: 50S ribosome-binding GTPase [Acidimicrobiia bacterium]|nr:50S ribosome-binding GTPase [Acidimicrobiia bacterium]